MKKLNSNKEIDVYIEKYDMGNVFFDEVRQHAELHIFNKGERICNMGERVKYFYFFVEGKASVYTLLENGKRFLIRFYSPLDVIGDVEILTGEYFTVNIQALSECKCIALPVDYVRQNCLDNNNFLKYMCKQLGTKLGSISYKSSINLLYPLKNRLASYIVEHDAEGCGSIEIDSSYSDMADELGTTYRHLSRTLKSLIEDGIIEKKKRKIIILDIDALEEIAVDIY